MTNWNINKLPRVPGSPCQGSCHRRWLRGSVNVSFSPSASLTLSSSLVRGSREREIARLVEEPKKAKIFQLFSRRGQKKRKSILPALLAPLVRGAGAVGDWGVVSTFLSPSASLTLGSSLIRGSREREIARLAEGAEGIEKLTDLHKKQDNKHIQKLRYLVAICHYVKPPSDEGGGKTKFWRRERKRQKLKRCSKTSLPQPRWRLAAPSSEGAKKEKLLV